MREYQAILQSGGDPVSIGSFPNDNAAQFWAIQRYGADLAAVIPVSSFSVTATTIDPIWFAVGLVGLLLLMANGVKHRRRGQNVR